MILNVAGQEIDIQRARLKKWLHLEQLRRERLVAAEGGNTDEVARLVCCYLSAAIGLEESTFQALPWFEIVKLISDVEHLHLIRIKFPILSPSKDKEEKVEWDYPERNWYSWLHLLAAQYGWTENVIAELDVETGVALIQEVQADQQLKREWEWARSEIAYDYKSGRLKPLDRPEWMRPAAKEVKKVKMALSMLPMGNVVDLSGTGLHGTAVH